jgi:hypothetical protein
MPPRVVELANVVRLYLPTQRAPALATMRLPAEPFLIFANKPRDPRLADPRPRRVAGLSGAPRHMALSCTSTVPVDSVRRPNLFT